MADTTGDKLDKLLSGLEGMAKKMTGFDARLAAVEQVRTDDAGSRSDDGKKLDKVLEFLDSLCKRVDAMEEKEKAKADAQEAAAGDPDGETKADSQQSGFVAAQVKADKAYQCFAVSAPRWLPGETLLDYQRRLLGKLKQYSDSWRGVSLSTLPDDALALAGEQIYADSMVFAASPSSVGPGQLREEHVRDATGRQITRFIGDPAACWAPFKMPSRAVIGMGVRATHR